LGRRPAWRWETLDPRTLTRDGAEAGWLGFAAFATTSSDTPDADGVDGPADAPAHVLSEHESTLALPWWFLTLLFALAPGRALWSWGRTRRRPPYACIACGYDLRATADPAGPLLATCPECGRASG
jgi:hypothetical protein